MERLILTALKLIAISTKRHVQDVERVGEKLIYKTGRNTKNAENFNNLGYFNIKLL